GRRRVLRRLRHLVAERLGTLPEGSALVVRALPAAATASSEELGANLDAALRRLRLSPSSRDNTGSTARIKIKRPAPTWPTRKTPTRPLGRHRWRAFCCSRSASTAKRSPRTFP